MSYPVKAIANAILNKAGSEGDKLTNLKLQKLLYYVAGYYAGAYKKPLIDEAFEAWAYGPVVPSIYREFQEFGNKPITRAATDMDWDSESYVPVPFPTDDKHLNGLIDWVWKSYGKLSAMQLSDMTHTSGSPWDLTRRINPGIKNSDITTDILIEYFSKKIKPKSS